jgi:two-component system CheB/CheR fusion protein
VGHSVEVGSDEGPHQVSKPSKGTDHPQPATEARDDATAPGTPAGAFPVVGIGASAGGLESFVQFLGAVPADSGMAFVVVQHLDPSHPSILSEILQRSTAMPVVEATDQMKVQPNRVHVIPPNRDLGIFHGVLQVSMPEVPRGLRMPIDAFMRSLAEDCGENAVGIVLSGTGTDGTLGLRAFWGAGGLCLVQDPGTARFDGMPQSAIHAGHAMMVLAPDQMPQALVNHLRHRPGHPSAKDARAQAGIDKILMHLRAGTGHDFSQYKKSTIGRRIERRMAQNSIDDHEQYGRFIREQPGELQKLFRDMLINVTSFFRDPQAFNVLRNEILPAMLADKPAGHVLRVWVAGCATGEEVYSIAIVLRELLDDSHNDMAVQIYGTDLDDEAIVVARTGWYPANIAQDVSPERLRRFFREEAHGWRVKKDLRDMVVFAVQSVIKDPPFTRLDLLACRNLMIYLEPELQDRLLPAFHYALRPGGVLFLSPSESIGNHTELFEPIDRKWKFYRAKPTFASTRKVLVSGQPWVTSIHTAPSPASGSRAKELQVGEMARRALLQSFAPAAVVIDARGNVLYVNGDTGRYLRPPPGLPSHNIVEMARDGLQHDLREALQRAADQKLPTVGREVGFVADAETRMVTLSLRALPDSDAGHDLWLLSFQETAPATLIEPARRQRSRRSADAQRIESLERELANARETLTALLEEQQASNEELKSANEEMQSTNEELQSTNEELETSKEELQSVNEEMMTVNAELQSKIEQMASMQDDMKNLLDNVRVGTIFLDRDLRIRRFTKDATQVYRLMPADVGRALADIRCELREADLLADAQAVLDSLVPIEREVCAAGGTWYLARIQPYRTVDSFIDGVVITLADVTERVNAIAVRKARDIAESIIDAMQHPLLLLDGDLKVLSANRAFYRLFSEVPAATVGRRIFEMEQGRWDVAAVHALLEDVPQSGTEVAPVPVELAVGPGRMQRLLIAASRLIDPSGSPDLVLLGIEPLNEA